METKFILRKLEQHLLGEIDRSERQLDSYAWQDAPTNAARERQHKYEMEEALRWVREMIEKESD